MQQDRTAGQRASERHDSQSNMTSAPAESMPAPPPRPRPSKSSSHLLDVSPYEVDFAALRMGKRIGAGSFGKVYLATWNETPIAVKVLVDETTALDELGRPAGALHRMATPVLDKLKEEAGLMSSLRHPNILQFMGLCTIPPCVLTEYCSKGSLADILRAGRQGKMGMAENLSWRRRIGMAMDAATGMLHLHARSPPIVHRDLKSPNLLVDSHWRVKVADFNLSRLVEESTGSSMAAMNPRWLAPEVLAGEGSATASDVFAFGIVMWEMLTWQLPWAKDGPWSVVNIVGQGGRLHIPSRWDIPGLDNDAFSGLDQYISLLQRCWAQNPYDRPSFSEIIQELRALEATTAAVTYSPTSVAGNAGTPTIVHDNTGQCADAEDAHCDGEEGKEMVSISASVSSTAAAVSMNELRSMPQYTSLSGWGSAKI